MIPPSPSSSASSPLPEASSGGRVGDRPTAAPDALDAVGGAVATVELQVDGMHCGSCVALIEETLAERRGVVSASVDLESGRAVIGYTPSLLRLDDLQATIEAVGYSATAVG